MKKPIAIVIKLCILLVFLFMITGTSELWAQDKKILIAYFTHTLNTEKVAKEIQQQTGGDIFRIETVAAYPTSYDALEDVTEKEKNDKARPKLKSDVENIGSYDVIFLGYPIWWQILPMPVNTFLESHDLSGKTIIPFCTHGGSKLSGTDDEIKKLEPNATVLDGLALTKSTIDGRQDSLKKAVSDWLAKLSY
ncbi:MAG: flavodoxin [Deltaproteobacteria bacterium]|jgi:flavodoxin|nr:flavodoxin [Deltaproteobacteria bacterium]